MAAVVPTTDSTGGGSNVPDAAAKKSSKRKILDDIPMDYRVDRMMKKFVLTDDELIIIWNKFSTVSSDGSDMVSQGDLLQVILKREPAAFTDPITDFIGTKLRGFMKFGEFMELICTFIFFEQLDFLKYMFYILDREKSGYVDKTELKYFIMNMHGDAVNSNLKIALERLDDLDLGDGRVTFKDILGLHKEYPITFYPLFLFQVDILLNFGGETFWENKKAEVKKYYVDAKANELARLKKLEEMAKKAGETQLEEMVMKRMGIVAYYLMPWNRAKERKKVQKMNEMKAAMGV